MHQLEWIVYTKSNTICCLITTSQLKWTFILKKWEVLLDTFFEGRKLDVFSPRNSKKGQKIPTALARKSPWNEGVLFTARDIPQILLLLGHFVIKKVPVKNCWHFLKNFTSTLKSFFSTFGNFSEHITHWKNFQILIYKTLKSFILEKIYFLRVFQNPRILFATRSTNVDQVLTKLFQIDLKLTLMFFIFWIMIISPN